MVAFDALHICTWSSMWEAFARFQEGDVLVLKDSVCFSSSSREKGSVRLVIRLIALLSQNGGRGGRWTSLDASFARCFAIF